MRGEKMREERSKEAEKRGREKMRRQNGRAEEILLMTRCGKGIFYPSLCI